MRRAVDELRRKIGGDCGDPATSFLLWRRVLLALR
jgi:hypothetical protein